MAHEDEVYCITFQKYDDLEDFNYYYRIYTNHYCFKDEDDLLDSVREDFWEFEMFDQDTYEMGVIFH